jgi:proteasome lid subunit RPN8/RPN11
VEICGVLIGNGYRDERGPFVYVEGNIRGDHSDSQAAQVTFTGETWNHIHNQLDRDWPHLQILGWYHTHPGFGVFLSGMDLFIHESYFSGEHHLALVYDPIGGDEGLFVWRNGKAVRDGLLVEPDAEEDPPPVAAEPPPEPMTAAAEMPDNAADGAADAELYSRIVRIENRQLIAELGVFIAILLALALPLLMWVLWIRPLAAPAVLPNAEQRPQKSSVKPPADSAAQADSPSDGDSPAARQERPNDGADRDGAADSGGASSDSKSDGAPPDGAIRDGDKDAIGGEDEGTGEIEDVKNDDPVNQLDGENNPSDGLPKKKKPTTSGQQPKAGSE